MEIEKTLTVSAPREQVWALLLDPQVMAGAVPGMKSIEVISPTEYVALMHQKISFISAKFRLRTHIVEQCAPEYLRAEGTGEDKSVASSLKQQTEVFLAPTPEGGTELRVKVNVDLLGRLGTFGLSVMKTKADRMWDEFGANLAARIEAGGVPVAVAAPVARAIAASGIREPGTSAASGTSAAKAAPALASAPAPAATATHQASASDSASASPSVVVTQGVPAGAEPSGWLSRLLGGGRPMRTNGRAARAGAVIRIEVRLIDRTVAVEWPVEAAEQCRDWLRELMKRPAEPSRR
jgi:carbon monoxide dehydrogenase subunit G